MPLREFFEIAFQVQGLLKPEINLPIVFLVNLLKELLKHLILCLKKKILDYKTLYN